MNTKETIINMLDNIDALFIYSSTLSDKLSICDKRLSDLYHCIETNEYKIHPMKIYQEMKVVLSERRQIKYDLNVMGELGKINNDLFKSKNPRNKLRKELKSLPTKYHNRYYSSNFKELREEEVE